MIRLHKFIASFFGIGYLGKGGGTIAAAIVAVLWILIPDHILTIPLQLFLVVVVLTFGVWSGNVVDQFWGKDSSKVVVDEVAGMLITIIFLPTDIRYVVTGLILFRFFDIAKPLFIKRMELLPKGWGVMADDVLAGIYAHILLAAVIHLRIY